MRAGELLQEAAAVDPRIAESMEMTRQQPRDGLDAATFIARPEDLPQRLSELTSHAMEPAPPKLAVVDRVDAGRAAPGSTVTSTGTATPSTPTRSAMR